MEHQPIVHLLVILNNTCINIYLIHIIYFKHLYIIVLHYNHGKQKSLEREAEYL